MAAELIEHTYVGVPVGAGGAGQASGMVETIVEATSTEDGDWIIIPEFEEIKMAIAVAISSNVHTPEAVTVDPTTKNKIVLQAGGTDLIRILVKGTPVVKD